MHLKFFEIPDEVIRAICKTLLHSLWQGLLLAIFAAFAIMFTRKSTSLFRYKLLVSGLLVFCFALVFTFLYTLDAENLSSTLMSEQGLKAETKNMTDTLFTNGSVEKNDILAFFDRHSAKIVVAWFLIALARTVQLSSGLNSLYILRKQATFQINDEFGELLAKLTTQLGIKRIVRIAESAAVKAPMVIGHLKPLILIPVGLFTALPPTAIEAILIHELAHVARRDYLVNLMMCLLEIVLFFNPGVLWIASLIRSEREHCCDDVVVEQTNSRAAYVKALIVCQEYQPTPPAYAMQLGGNGKHLLARVRRILSRDNQSLGTAEKSWLFASLVVASLCTVAISNVDKINYIVSNASHKNLGKQVNDTIGDQSKLISFPEDRHVLSAKPAPYHLRLDTSRHPFYVALDEKGISAQESNVDVAAPLFEIDEPTHPLVFDEADIQTQESVKGQAENQHHKYQSLADSLAQKRRALPKLTQLKTRLDYAALQLQYKADSMRKYGQSEMKYGPRKTGYDIKLPVALPELSKLPVAAREPINMKRQKSVFSPELLAEAMLNDGLVNNVKSYKLSETELILNGKKISDEAFKSFKDKNIDSIKKGTIVYYNYDTSTTVNRTQI